MAGSLTNYNPRTTTHEQGHLEAVRTGFGADITKSHPPLSRCDRLQSVGSKVIVRERESIIIGAWLFFCCLFFSVHIRIFLAYRSSKVLVCETESVIVGTRLWVVVFAYLWWYGVALSSRLLKIIGLFCRISSLVSGSYAKMTCNFKEPTNGSHLIYSLGLFYSKVIVCERELATGAAKS